MNIRNSNRPAILTAAIVGAASLLISMSAQAVFIALPDNTTEAGGVGQPLTTIAPTGTYVAHSQVAYSDPNFPGVAPGIFRSLVVNEGLPSGALTFYYQVVNLSTDPIDEIFRLEIGGYGDDSVFTVEAAYATSLGTISGIPGGAFTGPSITPTAGNTVFSADRDPANTSPNSAAFDFDALQGFGGANNILSGGEISNWLVLRTTSPVYSSIATLVNSGSVGSPAALSPIPEPSTVLFGLAMIGVCAGGRRRKAVAK